MKRLPHLGCILLVKLMKGDKPINTKNKFWLSLLMAIGSAGWGLPGQAGTIASLDLIGTGSISSSTVTQGSGITYNSSNNKYYVISDDDVNPTFYTVSITLDTSVSDSNAIDAVSVDSATTLKDSEGNLLANVVDGEGIALTNDGASLFISSEGVFTGSFDPDTVVTNPFVSRFSLSTGNQELSLSLADPYTTVGSTTTTGVRSNAVFESLALTPDNTKLFTALEFPLKEDQDTSFLPDSNPILQFLGGENQPGYVRLLQYDQAGSTYNAAAEYLYITQEGHGLVDFVVHPNDNNTLIALERSSDLLTTFQIQLFEVSLTGATNISGEGGFGCTSATIAAGTCASGIMPVTKTAITLDSGSSDLNSANFEGLTFGPQLTDGTDRSTLILISDNGGNPSSSNTEFLAFAINEVPFEVSPGLGLLVLGGAIATHHLKQQSKQKQLFKQQLPLQ